MKSAQIFSRFALGVVIASAPIVGSTACGDDTQINPVDGGGAGETGPVPTSEGGTEAGPEAGLTVNIPSLTAPVHAVYDEFGFLHVSGKTDDDVFATVGYFHAANRFFFMDFLRNAVRGTLGKLLVYPGIVDRDVTTRTFFSTPQGDPLPEKLVSQADAATKEYLDAYARGVNAWLADVKAGRSGASLTEEYKFSIISKDAPRDWEPADSMAVALFSLNDLSNNASSETTLGRVAQTALGLAGTRPGVAKTLQDLFLDFRPTFDAYTIPAANTAAMNFLPPPATGARSGPFSAYDPAVQKLLASASERLATLPGALPSKSTGDHGSNNWVISGSRATNGRPLVANDPHLSLTNPSIWFPLEIDSKSNGGTGTYHAAGGSFPGSPTVQTGHNENIAWGVTVTYWDLADVYLETLTKGGTAVSFNGADVDIVTKDVTFFDQGNMVTKKLAWVPHHGPIVSIDAAAGTAVTIRWRGHDGSTDVQAFFELDRANSIAEAKTALANVTTANQNFVIADKTGKIGYFPYAKVPTRPWAANTPGSSPFFPLTGNGTREWGPPVALTDIPQLEDPPAGFIATANADMNGASQSGDPLTPAPGNLPIQSVSRAEGTRIQRIMESIVATGKANTVETMRLLQGDTKSLIAATVVPKLLAAAAESGVVLTPETQHVVDALTAWQTAAQYTCPTGLDGNDPIGPKSPNADAARESIGCSAFHASLYSLIEAAFGDELKDPAVALGSASTNNTIPVLMRSLRSATYDPAVETFWQDIKTTDHVTTRSEILRRALTQAGLILAQLGLADEWRWGRMHTLRLLSPLSQPTMNQFDSALYATPGGLLTVNVASPSNVNTASNNSSQQRDFSHTSGPSIRTLIEVGTDTPHMKVTLPGGSDLHRQSKFYNNMVPGWLANTPVDFAFGPGAVKNPAADITVVAP
jgi:penicillin amidase